MLVIRLLRTGKKNQPSFKIVVVEKEKSSTSGRYIEEVGFYNPLTKEKKLKAERIKYWISVGAHPSETIHNMLISQKIIEGKKIALHKKSKKSASPADVPERHEEKPVEKPVEASPKQAEVVAPAEAAVEEIKTEPAEEKKEEKVKEKKEVEK
ncbi:MAG: 30S ribosomal protein S16 [Candidatus Pacebacteria bacterium]|nr:30S ribosomal protein S16 [Candidatus Paceibacterota bacterium]